MIDSIDSNYHLSNVHIAPIVFGEMSTYAAQRPPRAGRANLSAQAAAQRPQLAGRRKGANTKAAAAHSP